MRKLTNLALEQIEHQLVEKKASAPVLRDLLKMATENNRLEIERIKLSNEYLEAKIESEQAAARLDETIEEVIEALRTYTVNYEIIQ